MFNQIDKDSPISEIMLMLAIICLPLIILMFLLKIIYKVITG